MTPQQARKAYKGIRDRAQVKDHIFDEGVKARLVRKGWCTDTSPEELAKVSPVTWVKAARCISFPCGRCAGTGRFVTGSVNGQLVGPGGACFRCRGSGRLNDADNRRNYGHDIHQKVY
jgi:hypothetical protein